MQIHHAPPSGAKQPTSLLVRQRRIFSATDEGARGSTATLPGRLSLSYAAWTLSLLGRKRVGNSPLLSAGGAAWYTRACRCCAKNAIAYRMSIEIVITNKISRYRWSVHSSAASSIRLRVRRSTYEQEQDASEQPPCSKLHAQPACRWRYCRRGRRERLFRFRNLQLRALRTRSAAHLSPDLPDMACWRATADAL